MRGALVASLFAAACSSSATSPVPPEPKPGPSEKAKPKPKPKPFDPQRVLAVDITMPAADWETLRNQGRDMSALATECNSARAKKPYRAFKAKVTIDGTSMADVAVRKKGFMGSLSVLRPSLKLRFDAHVKGQRFAGMRRMTLNNNKQDRALVRQCLIYKVFRDAGLPAPLCNFARVTLNGKSLGVYTHVEPIKKPFLRRAFGDDTGALFEGQLSDFVSGWSASFQPKSKPPNDGPAPITALSTALQKPDAEVVAAVSAVMDYRSFLTFWAIENLVGHWDGYSNNRNNYYIYNNPRDSKIHFVPWGADMGFITRDPFHPRRKPQVFSADGTIAWRLWSVPAARADYVARMRELLATVWNEKALIAEIDRIDALLQGAPHDGDLAAVKAFITKRRATLIAELDKGGGEWTFAQRQTACFTRGDPIRGTFEAKFGTARGPNPITKGKAALNLSLGGKAVPMMPLGVVAGRDRNSNDAPIVRYVGLSGGTLYVVQLFFEEPLYRAGVTQKFHGFATWGLVLAIVPGKSFDLKGFIGDGSVTLDSAGTQTGDSIKGSFSGRVFLRPPKPKSKP